MENDAQRSLLNTVPPSKSRALTRRPPTAPLCVRATEPTCISTLTHDAESRGSKGALNRVLSMNPRLLQSFNQGQSNYQLGDRNVVMKRDECVQSYSCTPCVLAGLVQRRREFTAGRDRLLCGTHFHRLTDWSWPDAGRLSP
jgi:hypothetical protein